MRTIENNENFLVHLEKLNKLTLVLFNEFQTSEGLRCLIVLPFRLDGVGIISLTERANEEYINSSKLTKKLSNFIIQQVSVAVSKMKFKKKIENIEGSDGKKAKDSQFIA